MRSELSVRYIPKRKGYRKIVSYNSTGQELRQTHKKIGQLIEKETIQSKFAKAYIKKRSIITNAKVHMYNDVYICIDIKGFFSNINHITMTNLLFKEINKRKENNIITRNTCYKIVKSSSISNKGLGEGLILSPVLSNIYLKEFDNILYGKLKKMELNNIRYTRYADDIIISFQKGKDYCIDTIISQVEELLKRYKLKLNKSKTRVIDLDKSNHVRITGIIISKDEQNNRCLTVGRKKKNELYAKAINLSNKDKDSRYTGEVNKIKGLQSFILSVEGPGYEKSYSKTMIEVVNSRGYSTLKGLIDDL